MRTVPAFAEKLGAALDELEFLLDTPPETVESLYGTVARRHDDFRAVWLALAGKGCRECPAG